jgi:protoheme IX farnesyltransferase
VSAYLSLIRPRIMALVLVSLAAAAWTAGPATPDPLAVLHAAVGTALVIAGAVSLNQRLEAAGDAQMPRTAARPLPAGRLSRRQVTGFGLAASACGLAYLIVLSSGLVTALAAASWALYVLLYTPLKTRSPWQTPVGAVAGAMPVLLGAAAAGAPTSPAAIALFAVVFCWQLPHAMAIAWRYRAEFAAAGVRLATVVEPSGRVAGAIALLGALAAAPPSLWPLCASAGWGYALAAGLLNLALAAAALAFARRPGDRAARWLLVATLVYLPMLLAAWTVQLALR